MKKEGRDLGECSLTAGISQVKITHPKDRRREVIEGWPELI